MHNCSNSKRPLPSYEKNINLMMQMKVKPLTNLTYYAVYPENKRLGTLFHQKPIIMTRCGSSNKFILEYYSSANNVKKENTLKNTSVFQKIASLIRKYSRFLRKKQ